LDSNPIPEQRRDGVAYSKLPHLSSPPLLTHSPHQ
jgi:hypothetical protein